MDGTYCLLGADPTDLVVVKYTLWHYKPSANASDGFEPQPHTYKVEQVCQKGEKCRSNRKMVPNSNSKGYVMFQLDFDNLYLQFDLMGLYDPRKEKEYVDLNDEYLNSREHYVFDRTYHAEKEEIDINDNQLKLVLIAHRHPEDPDCFKENSVSFSYLQAGYDDSIKFLKEKQKVAHDPLEVERLQDDINVLEKKMQRLKKVYKCQQSHGTSIFKQKSLLCLEPVRKVDFFLIP